MEMKVTISQIVQLINEALEKEDWGIIRQLCRLLNDYNLDKKIIELVLAVIGLPLTVLNKLHLI